MFTTLAFLAIGLIAWWARRTPSQECSHSYRCWDDIYQSIAFVRKDMKLLGLVCADVLIMLGVVADKL